MPTQLGKGTLITAGHPRHTLLGLTLVGCISTEYLHQLTGIIFHHDLVFIPFNITLLINGKINIETQNGI